MISHLIACRGADHIRRRVDTPANLPEIGEARVDFFVELVDNLCGRILGRAKAWPDVLVSEPGTNSPTGGMSGSPP